MWPFGVFFKMRRVALWSPCVHYSTFGPAPRCNIFLRFRGCVIWPFEGFFKMRRVALWIHYFDEFVMFWRVALWLCFGPGRVAVSWRVFACRCVSQDARKMRARCAQEARLLRKMVARCAQDAYVSVVSVCVLSVLKVA